MTSRKIFIYKYKKLGNANLYQDESVSWHNSRSAIKWVSTFLHTFPSYPSKVPASLLSSQATKTFSNFFFASYQAAYFNCTPSTSPQPSEMHHLIPLHHSWIYTCHIQTANRFTPELRTQTPRGTSPELKVSEAKGWTKIQQDIPQSPDCVQGFCYQPTCWTR